MRRAEFGGDGVESYLKRYRENGDPKLLAKIQTILEEEANNAMHTDQREVGKPDG